MVSDRQKFANLVKENAEPDLAAMGLDIISFNVQNFVDGNEVIENLGIDNIVKIKKAAAIARAESERDIKVAQASADKESNDAAVAAQTEIAKKQNELAIKKSELQMEAEQRRLWRMRLTTSRRRSSVRPLRLPQQTLILQSRSERLS